MISNDMAKALNDQINKELYSAYLYLGMSAHAERHGMPGIAKWLFIQTQEEMSHAQKIYQYVLRQGAVIELEQIDKPHVDAENALALFEQVLDHEKLVTASINNLVDIAVKERDHATEVFLQWFVNEQVEEEENACQIIDQLKLAGSAGGGLFMIDRELSKRVFTPPAQEAGA
jgi:ferritin